MYLAIDLRLGLWPTNYSKSFQQYVEVTNVVGSDHWDILDFRGSLVEKLGPFSCSTSERGACND